MKKLILLIIMGGNIAINNLAAMESTYAEAAADRPVIASKNDEQEAMITIITSDKKEIQIPLSLAQKIPTINALFEDIGQAEGAVIPLTTINSREFETISMLFLPENLSKFLDEPVTIEDLVDVKSMSNTDLIALLNALDFLNLKQFTDKFLKDLSERQLSKQDWDLLNSNLIQKLWLISPVYKWILNSILKNIPANQYIADHHGVHAVFSPHHKFFAILNDGSFTVFAIDKESNKQLQHENLTGLVFSLDNHYIASWSQDDGTIKLWAISNNEINQIGDTMNHARVDSVNFMGNPTQDFSSWDSQDQKIWRLDSTLSIAISRNMGLRRNDQGEYDFLLSDNTFRSPPTPFYNAQLNVTDISLLGKFKNLTPDQIQLLVTLYHSQATATQWLLNKVRSLNITCKLTTSLSDLFARNARIP